MKSGLIFDFDGVIADSEVLAGTILAKFVNDLGLATTLHEALNRYGGKRWSDILAAVEDGFGQKLPEGFSERLKEATLSSFRQDLRAIEGVADFLAQFRELPHCVASSLDHALCFVARFVHELLSRGQHRISAGAYGYYAKT